MERIDYKKIIADYPWIVEKKQHAVISPDADGMISGLFMSNFLDWDIAGYYDNGKYLILKKDISAKDCIFLDTDIYRQEIRSCGHHIVLFRNSEIPSSWNNFSNCLNPNILRERSFKDNFNLKYPMGTIHLLLSIVGIKEDINLSKNALFPILQADGTINRVLDKFSENFFDWLEYLCGSDGGNILYKLLIQELDLFSFGKEYVNYVRHYVKDKKDKIPISDKNGLIENSFNDSFSEFSDACERQIREYLEFVADRTEWQYRKDRWLLNNFKIYTFTKRTEKPGVRKYNEAVSKNFLSLAITSTKSMEYTLEEPDNLP